MKTDPQKRKKWQAGTVLINFLTVFSLLGTTLTASFAPAYGDETIDWNTVDGGGDKSIGGGLELHGTFGQPDIGELSDGGFNLSGGFWFEYVPGDCDCDGVITIFDYEKFESCFNGPLNTTPNETCNCFDFDEDGNIDLRDFAQLQSSFA